MPDRVVKSRKFRYVEQKGFQTFFEKWKGKRLAGKTAMRETGTRTTIEHFDDDKRREDDVTYDDTSDDDEDSRFSHL